MIVDKIQNSKLYLELHPRFSKAFDFIHKTNISLLEDGKYEIDGDNIYALVQGYFTKDSESAKLEGHQKYIDVQYMHSGVELIGFAPIKNQALLSDDIENDVAFYEGEESFFKIEKEMFAIFFPHDLHMPGIKLNQSSLVKKVVIKVKT